MPINSKRKGDDGERSFRDCLCDAGFDAIRGRQIKGGPDSPDVICKELPFHFEVKFGATHSVNVAFRQAARQAGDLIPVVASKRNYGEWMVFLRARDFLEIVQRSDIINGSPSFTALPPLFEDAAE